MSSVIVVGSRFGVAGSQQPNPTRDHRGGRRTGRSASLSQRSRYAPRAPSLLHHQLGRDRGNKVDPRLCPAENTCNQQAAAFGKLRDYRVLNLVGKSAYPQASERNASPESENGVPASKPPPTTRKTPKYLGVLRGVSAWGERWGRGHWSSGRSRNPTFAGNDHPSRGYLIRWVVSWQRPWSKSASVSIMRQSPTAPPSQLVAIRTNSVRNAVNLRKRASISLICSIARE